MSRKYILALPSKGAIAEPTYAFLRDAGLKVSKPNERQYTGSIPSVPGLDVLFQRVKDVLYKVADGTAELGITGLDVVLENHDDNIVIIHDKLGYGHCQLVVAVPESWVDVEDMADIAELALDFRENKGRNLRVATTYPNLTRQFFSNHQIHHFTLVKAEGAIEAAPTIGYADMVIDLTQTGTTLRENHLKQIADGTIISAQACLIGNRQALLQNPELMNVLHQITEYMDAAMIGRNFYQIVVDVQGSSAQSVAKTVAQNPLTKGLLSPTVTPIYTGTKPDWFTVTVTVDSRNMLEAVNYLRSVGGIHAIVTPVRYLFLENSTTFDKLLQNLGLG